MLRREFENYPKEIEELILKLSKAPRKHNAVVFLGRKEQTIKPLLLPAPNTKLK